MGAAVWGEVANAAIQAGTAWLNSDAQRATNKKNLQIAREGWAFDERMSNTAVQRRVADITAAGGNPATAFVNGEQASAPVVTAPTLEAPKFDAPRINTGALLQGQLLQSQSDALKSQAIKNSADARATNLDSDIREAGADYEVKYRVLGAAQDYQNKQRQGASIEATIAQTESDTVARQLANFITNASKDDVIRALHSDAILKAAHIDPAQLSSSWAKTKKAILDKLTGAANDNTDYGPFHPEMLPSNWR